VILRPYQSNAVTATFNWWTAHEGNPLLVLPTAAGKSIICAELVRQVWDQWPDFHPRTVVLVPSKELAEQNAEKLVKLLPPSISVGFVSASLGKKQHLKDVVVATIGSIHKSAHLMGNIKIVIIDEAHLANNNGSETGMYRRFLTDLSKYCEFRVVGMTATAFRGDGVWLTDGDDPLFTGIAHTVTMRELLDAGYIAPLVPPAPGAITTRIDTRNVGISNGDYKVGELSDVVETYLQGVADESVRLAADRKKWIAFTPSVANAQSLASKLAARGITTHVVCGETPKQERETLIELFRSGDIRCLVTVLALSTGFDVPDVDCLIWCRPTRSPVLYVQGFGRACRIAPGKIDALVLDFTDTTERMGPVDLVKGHAKKRKDGEAPFVVCDNCGTRNHAKAMVCSECGAEIAHAEKEEKPAKASIAPVLSTQLQQAQVVWHDVSRIDYRIHNKEGKPNSLRVDYWSGFIVVGSEWVCFDHDGYARRKAEKWWNARTPFQGSDWQPCDTDSLFDAIQINRKKMKEPTRIATRKAGKYTEIVSYEFQRIESHERGTQKELA